MLISSSSEHAFNFRCEQDCSEFAVILILGTHKNPHSCPTTNPAGPRNADARIAAISVATLPRSTQSAPPGKHSRNFLIGPRGHSGGLTPWTSPIGGVLYGLHRLSAQRMRFHCENRSPNIDAAFVLAEALHLLPFQRLRLRSNCFEIEFRNGTKALPN